MFSHIMVGANDFDASRKFYDATFAEIGIKPGVADPLGRIFWVTDSGVFVITKPIDGRPASHGNGATIGFSVESSEQCDAWHAAGVAAGGTSCEDPPGERPDPLGGNPYYLAYLRDPAGNKLCALKHR
ncbi:MAG: VOC family protein [Endozoicomonas sp. (ex Botrylloides leachii)]|nr:VOC family protein [Endozoicomonas sp. (ex Botrylloides leachii)]